MGGVRVHLIDLDCYHRPSGHTHRWPLATAPGYQSRLTDDPAGVTWLPLVAEGSRVTVSVTAWGRVGGSTRSEIGDLRLGNHRREGGNLPTEMSVLNVTTGQWMRVALGLRPLSALLDDSVYVIRGIHERVIEAGAPLASAVTLWRGRAGIPQDRRTEILLPVYDPQLDYDAEILADAPRYAGTGGVEGPVELKDVAKERSYGWIPMLRPTYLGFWGNLHHWSTNGRNPIQGVVRGWSQGVAMSGVAGSPSIGQYAVTPATGMVTTDRRYEDFRLEVQGDKSGGVWRRRIGEICAHLATAAGLATVADVASMDATPRTVGLWLPPGSSTTFRAAFDRLCGSAPRGYWWIDLEERFVAGRLPLPDAGPAVRRYARARGDGDLVPRDHDRLAPAKQVVVLWGENPEPGEAAEGAAAGDATLWASQWRESASAVDAGVAAAWGRAARVERIETALALEADAAAETAAWAAELGVIRRPYEIRASDGAPGVWLGDRVAVTDDVAGFEVGANAIIYGRSVRDVGGGATLFLVR